MKIQGLVTAAGRSSRMGAFKPLLKLNGFPMIQVTVQSMKNAGVGHICVVTGRQGDAVSAALSGMDVACIHNARYAETDMLASVKLGLAQLRGADAVFLLPGDMPLVSLDTFAALETAAARTDAAVLYPVLNGRRVHPPLIRRTCFDTILAYDGPGGLRAVLTRFPWEEVAVSDPGAAMDADTPAQFAALEQLARERCGVSRALCEALYTEADLPEHIRAHCRAVGEAARHIAGQLLAAGQKLDLELCDSGGRLHDICRLHDSHEAVGAAFLRRRGYLALADIVAAHAGFVQPEPPDFDAAAVVCLADKLVQETRRVTIRQRYTPVLAQYPPDSEIGRAIRHSIVICEALCRRYEEITGEALI